MRRLLLVISAALLAAMITGCATSPAKQTEKLLTQSGFKVIPATTADQQRQLSSLPLNTVSRVKRSGKLYYVFPDQGRKTLYVGNQDQFQLYRRAVQDQYLTQDGKLLRESESASALSQDADEMTGAGLNWEHVWEGWPD
jgi:hypothetical protein